MDAELTRGDVAAAAVAAAVSSAIVGGRPQEEVLRLVAREAAARVDADIGTVGRVLGDVVEVVASWTREGSPQEGPPVGSRLPLEGSSPPAEVVRSGRTATWDEFADLDEASRAEVGDLSGAGSGIAVPVVLGDEIWGHFGAIAGAGRRMTAKDREAIERLTRAVGPLLHGLAARASATETQTFFQLSGDLFGILSPRGAIRRANAAFERVLGVTGADLMGSDWEQWLRSDDRAAGAEWLRRAASVQTQDRFDGHIAVHGAEDRVIRWAAHRDEDGGQLFMVGRDVTAEFAAQRERDEARVLHLSILDAAGEGIYGVDPKGRATFVNPAAARMFGFEQEEMIGVQTHALIHHSYGDGERYPIEACAMTHALLDGLKVRVDNEVFWRKDGTSFPVEYTATPIKVNGEPVGAVITFSDISSRKRLERARRETAVRESLERKNDELRRLADRLEESNADLAQFAYVASHDLQAPLRAIASHIELLADSLEGVMTDEAREDMAYVVGGATRMQLMIDSLLEFSRASRVDLASENVGLDLVADGALSMLSADIEEADATIIRPKSLPSVPGDETLLGRVFQNLIGNALRYRPEGSVVVTIDAARSPDGWRIGISDNGPGVPEEHREKIFEMFTRLHTADRGGGIGMGLALCERIVSRHNGSIWVEPSAEGGAWFRFELPADVAR